METGAQLRQFFEDIQAESGPPFDKWRIAAEPDLRIDQGFPALCYWLFDQNGKAHAFSFRDRADEPDLEWVRPELRIEMLKRSRQD